MIIKATYNILQWNLTKKPMDKQSPEAQAFCKKMWDDFNAKVKAEGFNLVLLPIIRQEIVEGMNKREQNLVAIIANTYLTGAVTFQPLEPEKPSDALDIPNDSLQK